MPKFIDAHPMKPFSADQLKKLQKAPPDEFAVAAAGHEPTSPRRLISRVELVRPPPRRRKW